MNNEINNNLNKLVGIKPTNKVNSFKTTIEDKIKVLEHLRDEAIEDRQNTSIYNDELINYYDIIIDKYNNEINSLEDTMK